MLSLTHVVCGTSCLGYGAFVFFSAKGTRLHRTIGTACVLAMLALNVTALCIDHLTGGFNLFHLFAVLSLAMVLIGWAQVVFRRHLRRWFYRHYTYMCWSYAGLAAATSNEAFVRIPASKGIVQRNANWVILATQAIILGLCAFILDRAKARLYQKYANVSAS